MCQFEKSECNESLKLDNKGELRAEKKNPTQIEIKPDLFYSIRKSWGFSVFSFRVKAKKKKRKTLLQHHCRGRFNQPSPSARRTHTHVRPANQRAITSAAATNTHLNSILSEYAWRVHTHPHTHMPLVAPSGVFGWGGGAGGPRFSGPLSRLNGGQA